MDAQRIVVVEGWNGKDRGLLVVCRRAVDRKAIF